VTFLIIAPYKYSYLLTYLLISLSKTVIEWLSWAIYLSEYFGYLKI